VATALITGASAGLGLEYARLFAADKHDLVLVARRRDRLEALAAELSKAHGIKVHVVSADLMEASAPQQIIDEVKQKGLQIDFLVNNAGFGSNGAFAELDLAKELGQVQVNIATLVALTRAFVPGMIARKQGRILNIGSTAGFLPGPFMAVYYATKAFVNSFTEALWYELKGTGVTATVSCPGPTATEFLVVAGNDKSKLALMGMMTATEVAVAGYRAMHAGKRQIVHGLTNKLSAMSVSMTPRPILLSVVASLNRKPAAEQGQIKAG
jgi:short-subunit dehydrogenase